MLRMLGNKLLVLVAEPKKASSVIQVVGASEKPTEGVVLAAGPGVHCDKTGVFIPTTVKEGDMVIFGKDAGQKVELDGEMFLVLHEPELYGVVPKTEE